MSRLIQYYDPKIWNNDVGDLTVDRSDLKPPYRTGLLHLIYWMTYTNEGRDFMHLNVPSPGGLTEAAVRANLTAKFTEFDVTGSRHDACMEAHFSGLAWVAAYNAKNAAVAAGDLNQAAICQTQMDTAEANYKQQVAAVTWFMWEDGTGELFPLPW